MYICIYKYTHVYMYVCIHEFMYIGISYRACGEAGLSTATSAALRRL